MKDRLKFRVWDKNLKKIKEVTQITLDESQKGSMCDVKGKVTVHFVYQPQYIIMQSTGLKDKNGKLIYEGDIVRYAEYEIDDIEPEWEQAEVVWGNTYDNYYPAFDLKDTDFDGTNAFAYLFNEGWTIEVIGNKFENPELLKERE